MSELMSQLMKRLALGLAMALAASLATGSEADPSAEQLVARHVEARGGAERWAAVDSLRAAGAYSAFSFKEPFTLVAGRGDAYRLNFSLLESPAVRARDGEGTWGLHKLLWPEPTRVDGSPYQRQLEREAVFGSPLLDSASRELTLEALGAGEVDGIPTIGLRLTWPDGLVETWQLDAETYLEVTVEYEIVDFTQARDPVLQRTFFDDFREVDGLLLPDYLEHQFNHRLESMTVDRWEVNPQIQDGAFLGPPMPENVPEDEPEKAPEAVD